MILGLNGYKGVGKDTVAAYLVEHHGFERRAFADKLKQSVATLLNCSLEDIENWKNDPHCEIEIAEYAGQADKDRRDGNLAFIHGQTFRSFLQRYGTESHRDIFGEDFWVDQCMPIGLDTAANIVVTDCRFPNEAQRIKYLGGHIVNIQRPGYNTEAHQSERPLENDLINYYIHNRHGLEELYDEIETMLRACHTAEDYYGQRRS